MLPAIIRNIVGFGSGKCWINKITLKAENNGSDSWFDKCEFLSLNANGDLSDKGGFSIKLLCHEIRVNVKAQRQVKELVINKEKAPLFPSPICSLFIPSVHLFIVYSRK